MIISPGFNIPDKEYWCTRCPRRYKVQKGNFPVTQSTLYRYNGGFLPICRHCVDELFSYYANTTGNEVDAIRRLCEKLDYYYAEAVVESSEKAQNGNGRMADYINKINRSSYKGKTYDDYLDELNLSRINSLDDIDSGRDGMAVSRKTIKFFGLGFEPEEYVYLQEQYKDWTSRYECQTKAQEELFKTICFSQLNMLKAQQSGSKQIESYKAFQDLLGSANIKPAQSNDTSLAEQNTFGTLIQKWENEKPIPEPEPEWKDVDGIRKYISTWFLGHLAKMFKIPNDCSEMYEEECQKYGVSPPRYDDADEAPGGVFSFNDEDGDNGS